MSTGLVENDAGWASSRSSLSLKQSSEQEAYLSINSILYSSLPSEHDSCLGTLP